MQNLKKATLKGSNRAPLRWYHKGPYPAILATVASVEYVPKGMSRLTALNVKCVARKLPSRRTPLEAGT